jgi:cation-transporting P-type ATPase E
MSLVQGLTQQEVRARQQRGESNAASFRSSRSYWDIIRANLFNFFNNILFAIGIALIALGQYNDAFTSVGQGLVNALIGTVQEINAKRKLDQIALLTRTKVHVIRDGQEQAVDPGELVKGDVVHVQAGDQIVVDGRVVGAASGFDGGQADCRRAVDLAVPVSGARGNLDAADHRDPHDRAGLPV